MVKGRALTRLVAYVPQEASDLLYSQSVVQELHNSDVDNELPAGATQALLNQLAPEIDLSVHPRDLSEGERLSLVLAIVLSCSPQVLVLDEPTRGLDYRAKHRLVETLKKIVPPESAIVLASHDVELVAQLATRVIVLADGEKVADGDVAEILTSSPAFAPQISKVFGAGKWLTVAEVLESIKGLDDA